MELGIIEKELERICKKVFNSTMYNFTCLMNNAYKDNEKSHVHFHFIPRYKSELKLFDKKYVDKHFGYNMWKWSLSRFKRQKDIFTQEERAKLFEMMKKEIKQKKCKTCKRIISDSKNKLGICPSCKEKSVKCSTFVISLALIAGIKKIGVSAVKLSNPFKRKP